MTQDQDSCKLCDFRLICLRNNEQFVMEYTGTKILGRKSPAMSSPENVIEMEVAKNCLFIFGGINTLNKHMNDEGYYMYTLEDNNMKLISVENQEHQKWLQRDSHTACTMKI